MELLKLFNALPGAVSQGVIWGLMAIGVYITYRILDVADLTVDGSIATGGAVAAMLIIAGCNVWVALLAAFLVGMLAGFVTGMFHTFMGIPAILSGILTQLALYSINLHIMGNKANVALSVNKYNLLISSRNARAVGLENPLIVLVLSNLAAFSRAAVQKTRKAAIFSLKIILTNLCTRYYNDVAFFEEKARKAAPFRPCAELKKCCIGGCRL